MLTRLDPRSADRLYPRDWPRVQRAIEFRFQTGRPISEHLDKRPAPPESARRIFPVALNPPRAELYARINERTEAHFAAGLVEEVNNLLDRGVPATSTALGAHGYRRVVEFLEGKRDLGSTVEQTKLDVRRYAKRQLTWFRREAGLVWFEGFGDQKAVQNSVLDFFQHTLLTKT
jgi:tRNA dimethylallyltransferase